MSVIIKDLTVAYDTKPVLSNINLHIPKGKLVAIVGPNGAGKSTLLKTILSLIKPVKGDITFTAIDNKKNKIAYVPQSETVDWDFPTTVIDVVMMGSYGQLGLFKRVGKLEKDKAIQALKMVKMEEYAERQIKNLSGGQQQRVFLARAIMQDSEIYFLDEPFKGIDVTTKKLIFRLLKRLRNRGKTVVVVHHDLKTIIDNFDWVTLINGEVIANGKVEEVFTNKNIKRTFQDY